MSQANFSKARRQELPLCIGQTEGTDPARIHDYKMHFYI